jgi:hypothetical protein
MLKWQRMAMSGTSWAGSTTLGREFAKQVERVLVEVGDPTRSGLDEGEP